MKRKCALLLGLLFGLGCLTSLFADGFIIVYDSPVPNPSLPPIHPPPFPRPPFPRPLPPPHRQYVFAPLEVLFHQVNVRIKDQVSVTSVEQEFFNPNEQNLEGTYLFPLPVGAAIRNFAMEIGGRKVEAELLPADKARQIYEDIVRKTKDPALMEYAGRDVFKVRVFPIEARGKKRISLSYSQVLSADAGLVKYAYPLNTEKFSARPIPQVQVRIELDSKKPLKSIYSPSHGIDVQRSGDYHADITWQTREAKPDTDFQLYYSAAGGEIGATLLTHQQGNDEGYFLLLAAPGQVSKEDTIVAKDIVFVLDTSGSMAGAKIEQARKALQFCMDNLNAVDRFELISFATDTRPLFRKLSEASAERRAEARTYVNNLKAIGGTAINDALQQALDARPAESKRPFMIIFLTDGRPTIGITGEDPILENVKKRFSSPPPAGGSARIFCFGVGTDVNTHLLDKITETTQAYSQYVLPEEDLEIKLSAFFMKINSPVLTQINLAFPEGVRTDRMYPHPLPDLFQGGQLVLVGRYAGSGQGTLRLTGQVEGRKAEFSFPVEFVRHSEANDFIPRLWATRRIGYLLDEIRLHGENAELKDEVVDLARQFGVVTPYTAYLIMEDESRRNVPQLVRSLPEFERDSVARVEAQAVARDWEQARTGDTAVTSARYGMALKSAAAPAEAISLGKAESSRSLMLRAGTAGVRSTPDSTGSTPEARLIQYAENSYYVAGKNFFQNSNAWIDAMIQKTANSPRTRIALGSTDYFKLVSSYPQVAPWLAIGPNVTFVYRNQIYEIHE
jgi:Ca-activated chloride channel family protein